MPTNLYGPGDNFDPVTSHVIPAMIRRFIEAKERGSASVTCWGTGRVSREFLYVNDAADAIVRAVDIAGDPSPINLAGSLRLTIRRVADFVAEFVGYKGDILWDASRPDGQPDRCLDSRKARELFDWWPTMTFGAGVRITVKWYLDNRGQRVES